MVSFKVLCPDCGEVDIPPKNMWLRVTSYDSGIDQIEYVKFRCECPKCKKRMEIQINA